MIEAMIEVMKQALEALTKYSDRVTEIRMKNEAITSLRQAIAEAEKQEVSQEPVAWLCKPDENGLFSFPTSNKGCKDCFPVFTTPPQREWVDLTDDEMLMIYGQQHEGKKYSLGRIVQAKLKEKNI